MMENIEFARLVGKVQLHVGRQTEEFMEYGGARRRPCYFRSMYERFVLRKSAGKTAPFHNTNDLAKLATENNLLTQRIHNAILETEQARNQSRAFSLSLENSTGENNELKIRCGKLQHDIGIYFHQQKSCEAAAKKALEDLDTTNKLVQARNDELRSLEHKHNTMALDKELQDQKFKRQEREHLSPGDDLTNLKCQNLSESAFVIVRKELEASQEETEHYKQISRIFRTIIQNTNVPMEINELDVGQRFKWLRQEIHKIIYVFYSMEKAYPVPGNPTLQSGETYLCNLFNLSPDQYEREVWVRAFVFGQLNKSILFKEVFGLQDLDKSLDRHAELAAWSTATMVCAKFLQPVSPNPPDLCKRVAGELMRLLKPLGKYPQEKTDQVMARWQELCMLAFKFTMKLRKYKDVYRCEMPALGDVVKDHDQMDIENELASKDCKKYAELNGWPIAYVLSGAWVRYSAEDPETKVGLVKPWVMVHAHPDE
ncbi:hypothetical protein BOTCAL_0220g00150 [Botryotinia calthae]|uniref:Uncharacterized protein n=1 Tax=Botryotinia calthae TaxID=38488 RepID=A0A4Y8D0Q9_9HELO|nr:hypothetical protein BOTCAL_0220g00150 [Botryotinia calthae]